MADILNSIFRHKKLNTARLLRFGFAPDGAEYVYHMRLAKSGFGLNVRVAADGGVFAEVIDPALGEPYTLHLAESAAGEFVGGVRGDYEAALTRIARECFEPDVFKAPQTAALIEYVRQNFDDELEFLWDKLPEAAIWRRKDSGKWYGLLMIVSRRKLGLPDDDMAEVLNFHLPAEELAALVDNRRFFPGYHMNKKYWGSVILDGSVPLSEIYPLLAAGYEMAAKKTKKAVK